jgi:hypothetical protein
MKARANSAGPNVPQLRTSWKWTMSQPKARPISTAAGISR